MVQRECNDVLFFMLWREAEKQGMVDGFGGAECRRVFQVWEELKGAKGVLSTWLIEEANCLPGSRTPVAGDVAGVPHVSPG